MIKDEQSRAQNKTNIKLVQNGLKTDVSLDEIINFNFS